MREILFRGKCVDNGKWVEGYLFINQSGANYILDTNNDGDNGIECRFILVIPETVGQYTGLTDKNGKKIFEGDICKLQEGHTSYYAVEWHPQKAQWIFRYIKDMREYYSFEQVEHSYCVKNGISKTEVIGNIFDNPELLGGR